MQTFSEDRVMQELEWVSNKLCSGGSSCLQILNNDFFDILYSIIYYVDHLSSKVRKELIQLLQIGLKNLKHYIDVRKYWDHAENNMLTTSIIQNGEIENNPQFKVIFLIQNSIKAYVYLITWFMSDNSKLKDNRDLNLTKRKKKGEAKPSNEIDNNAILMANKECIRILIQIIEHNVNFFWPEHKIDEDFINLFIKSGFDMLENPNNIKNQEIKNILFDLMQIVM